MSVSTLAFLCKMFFEFSYKLCNLFQHSILITWKNRLICKVDKKLVMQHKKNLLTGNNDLERIFIFMYCRHLFLKVAKIISRNNKITNDKLRKANIT